MPHGLLIEQWIRYVTEKMTKTMSWGHESPSDPNPLVWHRRLLFGLKVAMTHIKGFYQQIVQRPWLVGIIGAFAYAPGLYWALGLWSMAQLWCACTSATTVTQGYRWGWQWGFGFHVVGLHWIATAALIDPGQWAWVVPFIFLLFPAFLALFQGIIAGLAVWIRSCCGLGSRWHMVWLWPVLWLGAEYTQGHVWTGFPWNLSAYVWTGCWPMAQGVFLTGVYVWGAITWLAIGLCSVWRRHLYRWMMVIVLFSSIYTAGWWRLHQAIVTYHPHVWIRCVQPAVAQKDKINPATYSDQWQGLLQLTWENIDNVRAPTHVLWPETAIPWTLTPETMKNIRLQWPMNMLMGGDFIDEQGIHVGLIAAAPHNNLTPLYAKEHLVPGGEYIPLRSWLQRWFPPHWFQALTGNGTDFIAGQKQPRALEWPNTPPFRCVICYEGIFPGTIQAPDGQRRPQWILAISNDAWYSSWGQWQHFHNTRYRALEEGLPLIRVCNTGITAIIDPLGRVIQQLSPNTPGVLDGPLPQPLPIASS